MTVDSIIDKLHEFSPRLLQNQIKAANYIKGIFDEFNIPYQVEEFQTEIPVFTKYELIVDGKPINCRPASLVSGTIDSNDNVFDIYSENSIEGKPGLYYNSKSTSISRASHYQVPMLSFSSQDLATVKSAHMIHGEITVSKTHHISQNIILGNINNPTNLVFTHFDSLEGGAMDNASGTAVTILSIIKHPKLLDSNLFVISSDEELSFDKPCYWGKGYRDFEDKHGTLFETCKNIYIIDGLGLTPSIVHQDEVDEYFPISNIDKYLSKTFVISSDDEAIWSIYHSTDDTPDKLNSKFLDDSLQQIIKLLSPSSNYNIDVSQFPQEKTINIEASSLFEANSILASKTKTDIDRILNYCQQSLNYKELINQSRSHLQSLLLLRRQYQDLFVTSDGINHLENYLESFCGYCQGANISLDEGALLQLEIYAGCQSLAVKDTPTNQISGFHTEEDSTAYEMFGDPSTGKYWINININHKNIHFLGYAGLCGFGYSYSIISDQNNTLINTSDVLGPEVKGVLWANIVNFMVMDCTSLNMKKELVSKLNLLPKPKFIGGYTITTIECKSNPEMIQIEFGGDLITTIESYNESDYSYHSGINYPHHEYIRSIDAASIIEDPDESDLSGLRQVYQDRFDRLATAAKLISTSTPTFELLNKALNDPSGVWRHEWFTGYSNCYVANYMLFHISTNGFLNMKVVYGKP